LDPRVLWEPVIMTTASSNASSRRSIIAGVRAAHLRFLLGAALAVSVLLGVFSSPTTALAAPPPGSPAARIARQNLDGKININTATGEQLKLLPGVGPATAAKILAYRIRRPFAHPTHLLRISGIGRKTFNAMRRYVAVEGETTLHVPST